MHFLDKSIMYVCDFSLNPLLFTKYKSLKIFTILIRRSNYSVPIPPLGQPQVRRKMCVIKKGGALEKRVIRVFIQGGVGSQMQVEVGRCRQMCVYKQTHSDTFRQSRHNWVRLIHTYAYGVQIYICKSGAHLGTNRYL